MSCWANAQKKRQQCSDIDWLSYIIKNTETEKWEYDFWCGTERVSDVYSWCRMIFTNSFHGTVFSILFQKKKFYSVYKENGRISNLLTFLNLESRHIKAENEIDDTEVIDYTVLQTGFAVTEVSLLIIWRKELSNEIDRGISLQMNRERYRQKLILSKR